MALSNVLAHSSPALKIQNFLASGFFYTDNSGKTIKYSWLSDKLPIDLNSEDVKQKSMNIQESEKTLTEEVKNIILQTLREIYKDKITYHNNSIDQLNHQIKRLQTRIDQTYLDKLDGKITEEFWQSRTNEWLSEKDNLMIKLSATQKADMHFLENAEFILELAKNAAQMFKTASVEKKRRIVNILTSNCVYRDGNIDVELKAVFGVILNSAKTKDWCTVSIYFHNFIDDINLIFSIKQLLLST